MSNVLQNKKKVANNFIDKLNTFLLGHPDILAIFYGGSFARDYQDQFSDIEIVILCENTKKLSLREFIESMSECTLVHLGEETEKEIIFDTFLFQKEQVDLIYLTENYLEIVLNQFKNKLRVDPSTQAIVCCYQKLQILYKKYDYVLKNYKIDLDLELIEAIIKYANNTYNCSMLSIHIYREDFMMISNTVFAIQRAFLIYLFVINKKYLAGYKNIKYQLSTLQKVPVNFDLRLKDLQRLNDISLLEYIQTLYKDIRNLAKPDENTLRLMPVELNFTSIRQNSY
ncbi:MAG: hypothetical protein COB02_17785 [Candidatus Cloacimonadota bacterium]|nr:MAG: hypothetical protein COB02_17785 [Candidatus Cloacimonadota bacterium]